MSSMQLLNMLSDAVVISDEMGTITSANQYCLNLFGYEDNELIGQNVKVLMPPEMASKHDGFLAKYKATHTSKLMGKRTEIAAVTKSGKKIEIEIFLSELFRDNIKKYVAVIRDTSHIKQLEGLVLNSALYDDLTKLRTRYALSLDFEKLLLTELRYGYVSAVMLDIDEFQKLNTVFGRETGDIILKLLAHKISLMAQNHEAATYRVSGDRFLIISTNSLEETESADRVICMNDIAAIIPEIGQALNLPVSITAVCMRRPISDLSKKSILQLLEKSLEIARRDGNGGKLSQASDVGIDYALELDGLSMKLKSEMNNKSGFSLNHLDIAIQPKVNEHEKIVSCEALLRWKDPDFKLLYLSDFIRVAESTGAIIDVGHYVLRRVCKLLSELEPENRVRIYINLSIREFADKDFIDKIIGCCKEYKVSHYLLGFELTESMIAIDIEMVRSRLIELVALGFEIAVDDFGTGQSNLKYIHQLPVSSIKIDKSFIDDINGEADNYPVVDSIIEMAGHMKRTTVAEGVETAVQAKYLWENGVDEIQGYYYHKPMPENDILNLLSKH